MIGHGGPKTLRGGSPCAARRAGTVAVALALVLCGQRLRAADEPAGAARPTGAVADVRLRIAWGGGAARRWHGRIRTSEGRLERLERLGIEPDEVACLWLDRGEVVVSYREPRSYAGLDVTVRAPLSAELHIELRGGDEPPKLVRVPLAQLVDREHVESLDTGQNRLFIRRSPGDRLRVHLDRDALLFSPGETLACRIEPYLLSLEPGTRVRVDVEIRDLRAARTIWSAQQEGTAAEGLAPIGQLAYEVPMPAGEGVYDLVVTATVRRRPVNLGLRHMLAERRVQFVVVDRAAETSNRGHPASRVVLEIDPANPGWWERISPTRLVPGLRRGPLGSGDAHRWEHALGPMVQLGPGGREPNLGWEAYPLPLDSPGKPHILEVEYPANVPQSLGISILEPDASGKAAPIGLDSGFYVPDQAATEPARWQKHRLVFWPRTKTPLLLLTNRRDGAQAVYGKIRVLDAGGRLPRAAEFEGEATRMLAGYIDRPLLTENFSAPESLDAWSGRSLDDWSTFYLGGKRLVEYLQYVGYGGVMLSVYADGSTIYPSELVEPTPRFDTGPFFDTAQDARRKDALELVFRLFDRAGLVLIPAVEFATPLPELEALARQGGKTNQELGWIGTDGRSLLISHPPSQGRAPYYNVLHPRVQQAMQNVVAELVERYGHHPSFGGIAVQFSADGFAQLPGAPWGLDDETVARFAAETGVRMPDGGPDRFADRARLVSGTYREEWLSWRARALASFYQRMQTELASRREGAKLYLAGGAMLSNDRAPAELVPTLPPKAAVGDVLLARGVDAGLLGALPGVVFLRPVHVRPDHTLTRHIGTLELNQSGDIDERLSATETPAALFFHPPDTTRLSTFDRVSPFRHSQTWLISQLSPSSDYNRRRFVESLAALDGVAMFDGGWLLPLGQEESLRSLIEVYRSLPARKFETLPLSTEPVVMRQLAEGGRKFVYLANPSPWPCKVHLDLAAPAGCTFATLSGATAWSQQSDTPVEGTLTVELAAFDLAGARFSSQDVTVRQARVELVGDPTAELAARLRDLEARAIALQSQPPVDGVVNADFEIAGDPPPGWIVHRQPGTGATVDTSEGHSGTKSLKLSSEGPIASVVSQPFAARPTGRLAVLVWLKIADEDRQPPLRLAIQGKDYYSFASVGASRPGEDRQAVPLATRWAQYAFAVDDLPLEPGNSLRVRFDLMGPGEVWIDDVQVFDCRFRDNELRQLGKLITLASVKLQAGELRQCQRMLEGYWPRFLTTHVTLTQEPGADPPADETVPDESSDDQPPDDVPSGILGRINGLLPKFMRF